MLDFNINGEILIPLENSNFLSDKKEVTYKDLYQCSYRQFRNVLFQGELIKFYILLKTSNIEQSKIKQFFENIYFKIEFESTGGQKKMKMTYLLQTLKKLMKKIMNMKMLKENILMKRQIQNYMKYINKQLFLKIY